MVKSPHCSVRFCTCATNYSSIKELLVLASFAFIFQFLINSSDIRFLVCYTLLECALIGDTLNSPAVSNQVDN